MAYIVRADIEAMFGTISVADWADLNGNENAAEITARIDASILYAESNMNARLRDGRYIVPLTGHSDSTSLIQSIAATYAGAWLYQSRGFGDTTTTTKLAQLVYGDATTGMRGVDVQMDMIIAGQLRLDADKLHDDAATGMVVVT